MKIVVWTPQPARPSERILRLQLTEECGGLPILRVVDEQGKMIPQGNILYISQMGITVLSISRNSTSRPP